MIPEKDIIEIYKKHFPSRIEKISEHFVDEFVREIYKLGRTEDILKTKNDTLFVEKSIIKHILLLENENITPEYLSLYTRKMNSSVIMADKPTVFFDELLQYTLMSFYLMVFSLAHDNRRENFERCFKNFVVLLDLQGNKKEIGTHSIKDIIEMCKLPKEVVDLSMDTFWVSWTFIFIHELYHAKSNDEVSPIQEELNADKFAYITLLDMIVAQKYTKIPDEIKVFHEYLYLAPMMIMEYFKLLDFYHSLSGKGESDYTDHPSPELRQEKLFDMFDEYIPESFDTTIGNDLYNSFLDQIDVLREQLEIKKKKGKLDFLNNI